MFQCREDGQQDQVVDEICGMKIKSSLWKHKRKTSILGFFYTLQKLPTFHFWVSKVDL